VRTPHVDWRAAWHDEKMRSKRERPAAQLAALGIDAADAGSVLHIDLADEAAAAAPAARA
jgi:hypothetical protein